MSDIHTVVVQEARDGGLMVKVGRYSCFPDRGHPIPSEVRVGQEWEIEIVGQNQKNTVKFFKFKSQTKGDLARIYVYKGKWGTGWFYIGGELTLYKPGERIGRTDISDGIWEAHVTNLYMRFPGMDFVRKVGSVEQMLAEAEAGVRAECGGFLIQEIEALWLQAKREAGLFYDPDGKTHAYYIHQVINKTPHTSSELLARMKADISEALARTNAKVTTLLEATSAHTEWWFFYTGGLYGDHVKALPGTSEEEVRTFLVSKGIPNVLQLVNKYVDQEAEGGDTQFGHWVD